MIWSVYRKFWSTFSIISIMCKCYLMLGITKKVL